MIKVGVIFGGETVEHEVSIITAVQAMEYMDKTKYEVVPIYISKERIMYTGSCLKKMDTYKDLSKIPSITKEVVLCKKSDSFILQGMTGLHKIIEKIDIAFPIVHGKGVEDGSLSGYLETIGIPYVGSSMMGASIGQDKVVQKQVMSSNGIPVVDYVWFYDVEYNEDENKILNMIKKLGYPVIVKPGRLGSSVGINMAHNKSELTEAIEQAISYDEKIIVEKAVSNLLELDVAVVGNYDGVETSLIGEMITQNDILTFDDKYLSPTGKNSGGKISTGFKIPAKIDKEIENKVLEYAKEAFRALNLSGVTRFDFLVDKKSGEVYVNEPNTIPGCLAFFFFTKKGKTYTQLLDELITLSIKQYKNNKKKITSFESNVLSTYNGSSKCGKNKIQ